jgi:hypothetical protein
MATILAILGLILMGKWAADLARVSREAKTYRTRR